MIFGQTSEDRKVRTFTLSASFLDEYRGRQPKWGYGALSYLVFKDHYARPKPDGTTEEWWETLQRVVEGCFNIQKIHCRNLGLPWNEAKAQKSAQDMFQRMWSFKFLPPGRGLWAMGTDVVFTKGSASLNNCGFASSRDIDVDFADPFCFLMDMSMLGVGVGGDCKGAGKVRIQVPRLTEEVHLVEDSREGWVALVRRVLDSFVGKGSYPLRIDYGAVRRKGQPLKGFGGIASGPEPLHDLVSGLTQLLMPTGVDVSFEGTWESTMTARVGLPPANSPSPAYRIRSSHIVDIFNMIGKCVVAGGIRRSAEIMFGEPDDEEFITLKQDKAALMSHRWASNNSILAKIGMDYGPIAVSIAKNGEPGVAWLDNMRAFSRMCDPPDHKDRRVMGSNPCVEQSLEDRELCVGGDTPIQTRKGVFPIRDLVGKAVDVWNGDSWSRVEPRITGQGRKLLRVTLSDGSFLDCTANHGWHVRPQGKRVFRRVEAADLVPGSQVQSFTIDATIEGRHEPHAFEWGLFAGDGYIDHAKGHPLAVMCGQKAKLQDLDVHGIWYKPQVLEGYAEPVNRLNLRDQVPMSVALSLNDKALGIPTDVFGLDRESILEFVAGWIETDGTIVNQGSNAEGYRVYGGERKMRDLQVLLRRVGIDHATIRKMASEGDETNLGVRNYDLWYCQIPSYESADILTRVKVAHQFGCRMATNNAHPEGGPIDRARKQKVVSIAELPGDHVTYCFDEPENHMGVFGNVLTYQCNLVETFPAHHDDLEDYKKTLKMAYLYAKTVTLVPTHDPRANAVCMRNRRIGCSMSGIQQAKAKLGRRELLNWCDKGYSYVRELDDLYSEWLCVPRSIKVTSVKPSGTVSLLAGATPGIHHAHAKFYIRRKRVQDTSPLLKAIRDAGYKVEPDAYSPGTSVVEFPIQEPNFFKSKNDVTIWEQFCDAADLQRYWADNQVSITITFKNSEVQDIAACLSAFEDKLKAVSLLPLGDGDHGYVQAPYEAVDPLTYLEMCNVIRPIDFSAATHQEDERFCDSDTCLLPQRA